MKKFIIILFILSFTAPSLAGTIGGPELSVPEESMYYKQKAVNQALDRVGFELNMKGSLEIDILSKRELESAPADVSNAEIEGYGVMVKLSNNFYDILEPYVKIGSSDFEVTWDRNTDSVKVETDTGFVWGVGVKGKLWEFKDLGVKLTLDIQYRKFDLDVDKAKIGGSTETASAKEAKFQIKEWQTSLLASKKIVLTMGRNDYYIVPYGGLSYMNSDVDVAFTQSTTGGLYSLYNASDDNVFGVVLGCDIMPFYLSYYLLNFEVRLVNEYAFSLGGTVRF